MIHRFVDMLDEERRIIPYSLDFNDGVSFYTSLWMGKHASGSVELVTTREDNFSVTPKVVDPQLSPDELTVVYALIPDTGTVNQVCVISADGFEGPTVIATSPNANATSPVGFEASMQPWWHPDGSVILYRTTYADDPRDSHIRTVAPDGTGDTLLLTLDIDTTGRIWWPQYNFDGSRIGMLCASPAFGGALTVAVCDPDGTNFSIIATVYDTPGTDIPNPVLNQTPFAWANTQDTLAYYDYANNQVRTINGDGTSDTVIYTDLDPRWAIIRPSWLLDDSGIVYSQFDSGASDPKHTIGIVDAAGGGFAALSPTRKWYGASQGQYPRLFPQDGRIWWQAGDSSDVFIASVLPDGTDYTVEHDVNDATASWLASDGFSYHG